MSTTPTNLTFIKIIIKLNILKLQTKHYLISQDNRIYKISINISFFKYRTRQIKAAETNK